MEFVDEAFVLSARAHGEAGAIVDLLTAERGRFAAHVAGGASRKMRPFLQAGAQVGVRYRARTSEQLGSATLEPMGEGPPRCSTIPLRSRGCQRRRRWRAGALPEREPHPGAYEAFAALVAPSLTPRCGRLSSCASRRGCWTS
jgi:DNA repair protein RecO (recombination protein O)